jgi:hypothetical protein
MSTFQKLIRNTKWRLRHAIELRVWRKRLYDVPAPQKVKWAVLDRNAVPGATWIETGTYLGDTTDFLAARFPMVYSIEPATALYEAGRKRFGNRTNVKLLHGSSETVFPGLLKQLHGKVCFWLDGDASGGVTFQGASTTPVMTELLAIEAALPQFSSLVVLVDDMRCFDLTIPIYADYPTRSEIVAWADRNGLAWHIEHDIFVARRT